MRVQSIYQKIIASFLTMAICLSVAFMAEAAASDEAIRAFVQNTADRVTHVAGNQSMSNASKEAALTKIFLDVVDINFMAHSALGPAWRQLSPQDAGRYERAYKQYVISLYVPKFRYYNEHQYNIQSIMPRSGNQYMVLMDITAPGKRPISLGYLLSASSNNIKIRDIIAEDISLLSTQRSDFGSVMGSQGIEQLISSLENMARENEDGA